MAEPKRDILLSVGAAGGLLLLAWHTSVLLALLAGSALAWAWLMDWCRGSLYTPSHRLDGKVAVVTGANTGIGKETAKELAVRGARVILACRSKERGEEAVKQIKAEVGGQLEFRELDLASFKSVRKFAEELVASESKLDILVNNAGLAFQPRSITEDNQEQTIQVNHLGHFLLTNLLLDLLKAAPQARVVNLSSVGHKWAKEGIQFADLKWEKTKFDSWQAYAQSKLANIYFTRILADKLSGSNVSVYAVHPGSVATDLGRHYQAKIPSFLLPITDKVKLFLQDSQHGAQTSIYCAVEPSLTGNTGHYFANLSQEVPSKTAKDKDAAQKLWKISQDIVGDIKPLALGSGTRVQEVSKPVEKVSSPVEVDSSQVEPVSFEAVEEKNVVPKDVGQPQVELIGGIESFDQTNLSSVTTKEPLSGAELLKQELTVKAVNEEVESFDSAELKQTVVEEKTWLPSETEIKEEKEKVHHLEEIQNFNKDEELSKVQTAEPLSGAELLKKDLLSSELLSFDQSSMKTTTVTEKVVLPDKETLEMEKTREGFLKGVESFDQDSLTKVLTPEPLSGAELLKKELTLKSVVDSVETFSTSSLKSTTTEEKVSLPDADTIKAEKDRVNLLKDLESEHTLSSVVPKEPLSGAELLKQELTHKELMAGVAAFDSQALQPSKVEEKIVLPDAQVLESEKVRESLLKDLESEHSLNPVKTAEPLSGAALLKAELTHSSLLSGVAAFSKEDLRPASPREGGALPSQQEIEAEKQHLQHLEGIGGFDVGALKPVKTPEPLSGPEVARQESLRSGIGEEVQAFNREALKESETEEKVVLPRAEDIQQEKQHQGLLLDLETGPEGLKHVETREPSSPLSLAKMELSRDQVDVDIQAFDKARLTPVVTEEKLLLPTAEDIKAEALAKELDTEALNKELDSLETPETGSGGSSPGQAGGGAAALRNMMETQGDRERRSSSEEWEKVSSSEC